MTIMMPGLVQAVRDAAQGHFPWCNLGEHDYETPEHEVQLCKASATVRFPRPFKHGDEVSLFAVELAGSPADVTHDVPVPLASIGFNGDIPGWDMEPWKLVPLAMALLSAEARSRGDLAMERAYLDAANEAIDAHVIEAEAGGVGNLPTPSTPVVAQPPHHWSEGPFSYVQGGDPDDGVIPWEIYQAAQAVAPDVPAFIVQPGSEPGTRRVVAVESGKPVNDTVYTDADGNAPFGLRDRLNALPRKQVAA
jgi:hypothetical protein